MTHRIHQAPAHRRSLIRNSIAVFALVGSLALTACGSDDASDDAASSDAAADGGGSSAGGQEQDAGFGGDGHWTAAQLCSLADLATMGALFPGIEMVERTGIDEPDWSRCEWADATISRLSPRSDLFGVSQRDYDGHEFGDFWERFEVPGADQALFVETLDSDVTSVINVTVGDQQLEVTFVKDTAGAREVAELIATTWATTQSA